MGSRRLFVYLPRTGEPVAVAHRIEMQSVAGFPGRVLPYSRWEELHEALRSVVAGRRVAMEVAVDDAVPYLDRVPSGVVQLLQKLGATVVPSAALVTRFASTWSADDLADHVAAAAVLARVAQQALQRAVVAGRSGLTESALQREVIDAIHAGGLVFDHPPIVGFGPNAANPHYEPIAGSDRALSKDEVVLLDLWGGLRPGAVYADQTWMGFSGPRPPAEVQTVWETVRDARDAAIEFVRSGWSAGRPLRGIRGGPGGARGDHCRRIRSGLRPPDGALDRPPVARLGTPPGRLRDPRRPTTPDRGRAFRWSRASTSPAGSGSGAR